MYSMEVHKNWVLNGYDRDFKNTSKIKSTKLNFGIENINILVLGNQIARKFNIPKSSQKNNNNNCYYFQLNSEIKNFKKIKGWNR